MDEEGEDGTQEDYTCTVCGLVWCVCCSLCGFYHCECDPDYNPDSREQDTED